MIHPTHAADFDDDRASREDALLHRALERTATAADWSEIEALAERDGDVYRRLAALLRDECRLSACTRDAAHAVTAIELPHLEEVPTARGWRLRDFAALAVAAVFLGFVATLFASWPGRTPTSAPDTLASNSSNRLAPVRVSADGATTESDVSRVLVDARRAGEGWELLYLRKSFERVKVPQLYETALDDGGSATLVPVAFADPSQWKEL